MLLRNKLFYSIIVLIIIPSLIIAIVVRIVFLDSKIEEITYNTEQVLIQSNKNLDLLIEDASRTSLAILYDRPLLDILRRYDIDEKQIPTLRHREAFTSMLASIMYKRESIYGIHVFSNNGFLFSHANKQMNMTNYDVTNEKWYEKAKSQSGAGVIYAAEKPSYYVNEVEEMISFVRVIRDPIDHKEIGIIKLDFNPNILNNQVESRGIAEWDVSLNDESLIHRKNDDLLEACINNKSWIMDKQTKENYLCLLNKSEQTDVIYRNLIPKDYVYKEIQEFDRVLIIITLIIIVFSLGISYYVSRRLMEPLEKLKTQAVNMHNEFKGYHFQDEEKGDIVVLSGVYNEMFEEIESLFKQLYQLQFINAEAEYRALQAKMNPHFLFNTLESINMLAIKNQQFELSDKIVELGKLIRYNLKNEEPFVKLREEINFTKTYISIMQSRMTQNISVKWIVEPELMNEEVPKYIIQPIIENSLNHGFYGEPMSLIIEIRSEGKSIKIKINDDGIGISEIKLKELYRRLNLNVQSNKRRRKESNGIALVNIKERLTLTYGMDGKLIIESTEGKGTKVIILIPRREKE